MPDSRMDRNCPNCGEPVEVGREFCAHCGVFVAPKQPDDVDRRERQWGWGPTGCLIAIAIVMALMAGCGLDVALTDKSGYGFATIGWFFAIIGGVGLVIASAAIWIGRSRKGR